MFHRRSGNGKGKIVKTQGKEPRNAGSGREGRHRNKSWKWHRRTGRRPDKTEMTEKKNCNMQSWERAKPLSPHDVFLNDRRRMSGWNVMWKRQPIGIIWVVKIPPSDCLFIDPVLMRRRSLRLPSPDSFPNSDGNTGAFFSGGKLP